MFRIDYDKELIKDILMSCAYFELRKYLFQDKEVNYFTDLFKDCRADLFNKPTNLELTEAIATKCGELITNRKATYEDIYARIGYDLMSREVIEANKDMISNAEQHIKDCNEQIASCGDAVITLRDDLGGLRTYKLEKTFGKEIMKIMFGLEIRLSQKVKEYFEKQGKEVMVIAPKIAELLL